MKKTESKIKGIPFGVLLAGKVADGTKTVTRRVADTGMYCIDEIHPLETRQREMKAMLSNPKVCPYAVGQLMYVRESHWAYGDWKRNGETKGGDKSWKFHQNATHPVLFEKPDYVLSGYYDAGLGYYKRLARFMPKRFARTFIKVTGVRCERLLDISGEDAIAEGVEFDENGNFLNYEHLGKPVYPFVNDYRGARGSFLTLWNKINGKDAHLQNPWVWVIEFERVEMPNPWNSNQFRK